MTCERCLQLEERVRILECDLYGLRWEAPACLGLTMAEEAILATLYGHTRTVSSYVLMLATRGLRHSQRDDVDPKVIHVMMSKLRRKLAGAGIEIETVWGRGFRLPQHSRQRLAAMETQEQAA